MIYLYYNTRDKIHGSGIGHNILNINYYYYISLKLNAKFILLNIAYIHNKYLLSTESKIFSKYLKIKDKNIITNKNKYDELKFKNTGKKELFFDKLYEFDIYTNDNNDKMYMINNKWNNYIFIKNPPFYDNSLFDFSDNFKNEMNDKYSNYTNLVTCHIRQGNGEISNDRLDLHEDKINFNRLIIIYKIILIQILESNNDKVLIISDNSESYNLFREFNVVQSKNNIDDKSHNNLNENDNLELYFYYILKDIYLMSKSKYLIRHRSVFSLVPLCFNKNTKLINLVFSLKNN